MSGIKFSEVDRVMVARFDRPERANALTIAMQAELVASLGACERRPDLAGTVIFGGDGKVFSGGADVRESDPALTPAIFAERRSRQLFDLLRAVLLHPKPVIGAINGHAVGSGCLLAMVADLRIAADSASFSLPEIERGQPTFAGAAVLTHQANRSVAASLVQTGRRLLMDEAVRLGLVHAVTSATDLLAEACAAASRLAAHPIAFAQNKRWLNGALVRELDRAARESADARAERQRSANAGDGTGSDRRQSDPILDVE